MPPKKSGKSKATARTARQKTAETPRQPARRQETAEMPRQSARRQETAETPRQPAHRQETAETPRQPARRQDMAEGSGSYDRFNLVLPPELADLPARNIQAQV